MLFVRSVVLASSFTDGIGYLLGNPDIVGGLLAQHLQLMGIALGAALVIALPLAVLLDHVHWLAVPVMGTLGIAYTIPSLALIILLIPLFGLGATPVIIALVIYAQIILVRNTLVGFQSVNPATLEAARGMGMNEWRVWSRVQLPLSLPIILAGVRIAAVTTIGIAAVGAKFGAGGLGTLLFDGIATKRDDKIWAGAIAVALFAFAVNGLLLLLQRATDPATKTRTRRPDRVRQTAVIEGTQTVRG